MGNEIKITSMCSQKKSVAPELTKSSPYIKTLCVVLLKNTLLPGVLFLLKLLY